MSNKELKEEIFKAVDKVPEAFLNDILSYIKNLEDKGNKPGIDDIDKKILQKHDNLFKRLAK